MKNSPCIQRAYPPKIFTGLWPGGHIQGIAVDQQHGWIYCSFTTQLVKLDLGGKLLGSVKGLTGHLGCLCLNRQDGRVYGSLEYKNDAIGQGILKRQGLTGVQPDAFYIAIFDGEKINRPDMDAEEDGVMTTVYLRDVAEDYRWTDESGERAHRYGCSGIDGISFGPAFGQGDDMPWDLYVAYGVYGDNSRSDNDYQVLLRYDIAGWHQWAQPLSQKNIHQSGPQCCKDRYFVFTGNTTYGIQNLEYDPFTGHWLMAVYPGKKPAYPNHPFYIIDGSRAPSLEPLRGLEGSQGKVLILLAQGPAHPSGVFGWEFPYGSTGIAALGDGLYYFSQDQKEGGLYGSHICLYHWTGKPDGPFELA